MKRLTALTSLLIIGTTLSYIVSSLLASDAIQLDLSDEDIHLYL
ncbi:hypothetical protein BH24BAC1_BH24BAC1_36660 [soil metagenome]